MFDMIEKNKTTKLSRKAQEIIAKRYSLKDAEGMPVESWTEVCRRVATAVMKQSPNAGALLQLMLDTVFVPNTPCLVNAGKPDGQLAACFVLAVPDSIDGIMEHAQVVANIHKSGGGTGMSYEFLRPAGAQVSTSGGQASGPVSFMEIVNKVTDVVKQGGVRRGANMGILSISHPDVLRFIHAKNDQHSLTNFNISVTVTDAFMEAVERGEWFHLEFDGRKWDKPIFDPVTGRDYALYYRQSVLNQLEYPNALPASLPKFFADAQAFRQALAEEYTAGIFDPSPYSDFRELLAAPVDFEKTLGIVQPPQPGMVYAPDIWNRIIASAHKYAEPGVIFIDRVNQHNYLMNSRGPIHSCNPCGEEFLHAGNSCNLGSIDVSKFVDGEGRFDYDGFGRAIHLAVEFLDNVVDESVWTTAEIDATVKATRPVGLGPMGIGDALIKTKIAYGSAESYEWLDRILSFFRKTAWEASFKLGKEKGVFPEYEANRGLYEDFFFDLFGLTCQCDGPNETHEHGYDCGNHYFTPRNYEVTTIAPTGTISLIAGCSSGIEPNFSFAYFREDTISRSGSVHPLAAQRLGVEFDEYDDDSVYAAAQEVARRQNELPPYFVGAMDISAEQHVRMLAAAQKHIDNSISKTCNGSNSDTVESVDRLYRLAFDSRCKAVSYYRDGSRDNQVLQTVAAADPVAANAADQAAVETAAPTPEPTAATVTATTAATATVRPTRLSGHTYRFKVGGDWEYFTVNRDESGNIVEVFNGGGNVSSSVGLLMSKMLQCGAFTVDELARTLDKSKGEFSIVIESQIVTSPEQAFAHILRVESGSALSRDQKTRMVEAGAGAGATAAARTSADDFVSAEAFRKCPECSQMALTKAGGCDTCQRCGWSKC